jgi:hypothetical protein
MSQTAPPPPDRPGAYVLPFGPLKGQTLDAAYTARYRLPNGNVATGADYLHWVLSHYLLGDKAEDFGADVAWESRVHIGNFLADREPGLYDSYRLPWPYGAESQ